MRIAVFIKGTTFHKNYGGLETMNRTLCEGLAQRGHELTVFSPKRDVTQTTANLKNVHYVFIPAVYRTIYLPFMGENWYKKSLEVFKKLHSTKPFDLVLSQSSAGLYILNKKRELNVNAISISHGSIISELSTRFNNNHNLMDWARMFPDTVFALYNFFIRQRAFIHASDRVVAVSNYVKDTLIEETYSVEDKFRVIHNGVDINMFPEKPFKPHKQVRLLYIGQITKEKGLETLLKLAQEPAMAEVRFDVVGGGPFESTLKQLIKAKNLDGRFFIHGKVAYEKLPEFYSQADVFLFPTKRVEGFPMVLVEAMLNSLPVVAYNLGGVQDAVVSSKTGFLCEGGNYAVFLEKLLLLVRGSETRARMAENARMKAVQEFSLETMLDKYEAVIKELAK